MGLAAATGPLPPCQWFLTFQTSQAPRHNMECHDRSANLFFPRAEAFLQTNFTSPLLCPRARGHSAAAVSPRRRPGTGALRHTGGGERWLLRPPRAAAARARGGPRRRTGAVSPITTTVASRGRAAAPSILQPAEALQRASSYWRMRCASQQLAVSMSGRVRRRG